MRFYRSIITVLFLFCPLFTSNAIYTSNLDKCYITTSSLTINHEHVPLADYILELIVAYGKHTASTHVAHDAVRYAGLGHLNEQIHNFTLLHSTGYSGVMILLRAANERAIKIENRLRCFENALDIGFKKGMGRAAMMKVVQIMREEVEDAKTKLGKQRNLLIAAMGSSGHHSPKSVNNNLVKNHEG